MQYGVFSPFFSRLCNFDSNWLLFTSFCYSPHCVALHFASMTNSEVVILCTAHDLIDISFLFDCNHVKTNAMHTMSPLHLHVPLQMRHLLGIFIDFCNETNGSFVVQCRHNEWSLSSAIESVNWFVEKKAHVRDWYSFWNVKFRSYILRRHLLLADESINNIFKRMFYHCTLSAHFKEFGSVCCLIIRTKIHWPLNFA